MSSKAAQERYPNGRGATPGVVETMREAFDAGQAHALSEAYEAYFQALPRGDYETFDLGAFGAKIRALKVGVRA